MAGFLYTEKYDRFLRNNAYHKSADKACQLQNLIWNAMGLLKHSAYSISIRADTRVLIWPMSEVE